MVRHADQVHFSTRTWVGFVGVLFGNTVMVFGGLLYWANRIVILETKMANNEVAIAEGFSEVRSDIKQILRQTRGDQ